MTQPAVSRQVGGLERKLGVRLFQRVPRGVRPTSAGDTAVDLARDILDRLRAMEAAVGAFSALATGRLRLSGFPSANTYLIPEAVRRFSRAHPGVSLTLLQADSGGATAALRESRIDLALITAWDLPTKSDSSGPDMQPVEGIELTPLLDEELRVAMPASHRLAERSRVALRDLRDETWIEGAHPDCLGPVTALAGGLGQSPRIGFTCDDWNGKQALVAAGVGLTLVPTLAQAALRHDVVLRPTTPSLPTRRLFAATTAEPFRSPAVTAILPVLVAIAAENRN